MRTTIVAPDRWLAEDAAASYLRARAAGVPAGITSAGRTSAEQEVLFRARYTTNYAASAKFDPREWQGITWWRRPGADAAAPPGAPYSRHETGRALDLPAGGAREWMRAHGAAYGWIGGLVKGEPWHFEYQPDRDQHRTPTPPTPPPAPAGPDPWEVLSMDRIIEALYRRHLGRKAATTEVDHWLDQYAAGATLQAIRNAIYNSPEAAKRRAG